MIFNSYNTQSLHNDYYCVLPEGYTMSMPGVDHEHGSPTMSMCVSADTHEQAGASLTPGGGGKADAGKSSYIPLSIRKFKKGFQCPSLRS